MMHITTEESEAADILPLRHKSSMLHHLLNEYSNALKGEGKQTQRNQRLQLAVFSQACSKTKPDLPVPALLPSCVGSWPGSPSSSAPPQLTAVPGAGLGGLFFLAPVAETTAGMDK